MTYSWNSIEAIKTLYDDFMDDDLEEKRLFMKYGVRIWKIQYLTLIIFAVDYVVVFPYPYLCMR